MPQALTDEQRQFAAENHNLIYKYLWDQRLEIDDYYDIAVFGYLRAVKRYLTEPWLRRYQFSTVAWHAMRQNIASFHRLRSIDRDSSINNLIAKLVPENEEHIFTKSKYVISLSSWFSDNIIQKKIFSICDAIDNHRCISIEYISKTSHTMRIVEPHKLVFKQSNWYLYAFCRNKNSFRLFKLRRILSYQILEEQFDFKEIGHIDFEENYGSGLFSHHDTDGAFLVILEYDTEDEFILTEKIDASFFSKANEQTSVSQIRFYTSDLSFATDTVFSILDKVRVISPPALYKAVQRRLESINSYYKR